MLQDDEREVKILIDMKCNFHTFITVKIPYSYLLILSVVALFPFKSMGCEMTRNGTEYA
jgi:hypothetical protein